MSTDTSHADLLASSLCRLDQLVNWETADRRKMVPDLSPMHDLLARLANPEREFRSLHVTGTKGKGSVCALIEAGLIGAGLAVGRYASPHVERLNERISCFGDPIDDLMLSTALEQSLDAYVAAQTNGSPAKNATWFDVLTASAFYTFAKAHVDWAVVEVGLGGRLDSTNVIQADVAVITNVGLEHTDILGDSVEKIAYEKAGIIKEGAAVVTSLRPDTGAGAVVYEVARGRGARCYTPSVSPGASIFEENVTLARAALEQLGSRGVLSRVRNAPLCAQDLSDVLAGQVQLPGRSERYSIRVPEGKALVDVILDGAHVGFALSRTLNDLRSDPRLAKGPIVLLALGSDKDAEAMIAPLAGVASHIVCTTIGSKRPTMDPKRLFETAVARGISAEIVQSPMDGFRRCLQRCATSWVLVVGSLHLVGAVRKELREYAKT